MQALKKITVRDVMKGKPDKEEYIGEGGVKEMRVKAQDVCVIRGFAHDFETGKSDFGSYNRFIGNFEALRISDGEVFQSTRIIFPPIATDIATEHFLSAKREDESALVEFCFVVGVEYDARGGEGYRWTCKPVMTGEGIVDPLEAIRQRTNEALMKILGVSVSEKLALTLAAPSKQIPHDKTTGEVIEPKAEPKATAKA